MKVPRQRFGEHDEVTIRGVRYHWLRRSGDGHVFGRLDPPIIEEAFSDQRLAEEVGRPDYARRRDHLNPAKIEVRAASGLRGVRDLPEHERGKVALRRDVVRRFLELAAEGVVNRTEVGATMAIDVIADELHPRPGKDVAGSGKRSKPRIDSVLVEGERERLDRLRGSMPCARTLLGWVRMYERGAEASASLRDGRHGSGNTCARYGAEVRRHVSECADEFLSRLRPHIQACHDELRLRLMHLNEAREREDLPKVTCPSIKYLTKEIKDRRAVHVHAARHGADEASKLFSPLGEGLDVTYVGQRVEMDEWCVPVQNLLEQKGVWPVLSPAWRKTALKARLYACTAIDTASRVPLGIALARKNNTLENALTCLAMVATDKTALSEWAGAETPWSMACAPDEVVTDNGSGFVAEEFQNAVEDLGGRPTKTIAGKSSMRGRKERLFRSIVMRLGGHLPGRTFANPVEKGDYDPEARAVIFEEMMLKILIVHLLDSYCCRPHGGLGKQTPIDVYERLVDEYHVNGDPGPHVRREAFGVDAECDLDRHGVRKFNLNWTSDELQAHFRHRGSHLVRVRFDPSDLGWASVWVDGKWVTCGCRREGMEGMPLVVWQAHEADRNRRAKSKALEREGVVLRSLEKVKTMVRGELDRFGILHRRFKTEDLELIEKRMLDGFVSPERRDAHANAPTLVDVFETAWSTGATPLDQASEPDDAGETDDASAHDDPVGCEDAVEGDATPPARPPVARKRARVRKATGAASDSSAKVRESDDDDQDDEAVRNGGQGQDVDFTFERR